MHVLLTLRRVLARPWLPAKASKGPYLWSLCLLFLFWQTLYQPPGARELVWLLLSMVLFQPLYLPASGCATDVCCRCWSPPC